MSTNVDKRIVEMQFDNKQFENGIQTSVKSLDQLKKGLDLEKSVKGLNNLEKAGRSFSLAGISDSVSAISGRFSAMGIIGMTALQNIANSAYNAGKRIVSALTIDPVKMGFSSTRPRSAQFRRFSRIPHLQWIRPDILNNRGSILSMVNWMS